MFHCINLFGAVLDCGNNFRFIFRNMDDLDTETQASQRSTQSDKIWSLKDGCMAVVGLGKKRARDSYMTLDLEFKFENERKSRKVGELINILI